MIYKDKPVVANNYNSHVIIMLLFIVVCSHMLYTYNKNNKEIHRINFDNIYHKNLVNNMIVCDKWIVTDNATTENSGVFPLDWCVVYTGKGINVNKRNVFINSNRNDAYVYAIRNGAKWIFDTTSALPLKNVLFLNKLIEYKLDDSILWRNKNTYVNPLPSLGCIDCYPPYFPISKVKDQTTYKENKNEMKIKIPLKDSVIYHSATTSHDQLYSFLKNEEKMIFPEELDLSITLPIYTYTPIITHSTVYRSDVFPVLYMFKSIIIRSYFIQTYLHHVNKHVTVFSPFVLGGELFPFEYTDITINGIPNIVCNLDTEKTKYHKAEKLGICFYEYGLISLEEFKEFQYWLYDVYTI